MTKEEAKQDLWHNKNIDAATKTEVDKLLDKVFAGLEKKLEYEKKKIIENFTKDIANLSLT